MGDEMLSLFYDKEILKYTKAVEGKNISSYEKEAEFRLFRDYFGLIHLIQSCEVQGNTRQKQRGYEEMLGYASTLERNRLDSVDSDIWSDSSSGGKDFDTSLDNMTNCLVSPSLAPGFMNARCFDTDDETRVCPASVLGDLQANKINAARRNQNVCVFCRNNGESKKVYSSHVLKDAQGNTTCPILRAYTCPLCKASGDESHTIKYCPKNKNNRLDK